MDQATERDWATEALRQHAERNRRRGRTLHGFVFRPPPSVAELEAIWAAANAAPSRPCMLPRAECGCCSRGEPSCAWGRWLQAIDHADPETMAAFYRTPAQVARLAELEAIRQQALAKRQLAAGGV